jgi:5-methylcytosine-specific restriction protein A
MGLTHATWCDEHAKDKEATTQRDRWRGTAASRGYSNGWPKARAQSLKAACYLCQYCLRKRKVTPATEVDHEIPIEDAPHLRLAQSNLVPTCHPCHMAKHANDRKR